MIVMKMVHSMLRGCLRMRRLVTDEKFVFLESPWVGIGNRIKALANAYVGEGKAHIYLRWGLDEWVPEPFENLFRMTDAPGFRVVSSRITGVYPLWFYPYPQKQRTNDSSFWRFWVPPERAALGWGGLTRRDAASTGEERGMTRRDAASTVGARDGFYYGASEDNMLIDWHYNEIPSELIELYRPFFEQLEPSEKVKSCLREIEGEMAKIGTDAAELVMVQIRNCANKGDVLRVSSVDSIVRRMEAYSDRQKFYLSCLEKEVSDKIHAAFPGRVIELPNKDYRSMVDSVADMWMLGRGRELICSPHSTFNEVAWWWGGAKARVTMVEADVGVRGETRNVF